MVFVSRAIRTTLVAIVAVLALWLVPSPAYAHAQFTGSDPADGSTLDAVPAQVTLSFNEEPNPSFLTTVVTVDGKPLDLAAPTASGNDVRQVLPPDAPGGSYTVTYRVVSVDGHPISGKIGFTVNLATAPATTSTDGAVSMPGPTVNESATPQATATQAPTQAAATIGADASQGESTPLLLWLGVGAAALLAVGALVRFTRRQRT